MTRKSPHTPQYELSVCAIFRNEAPTLKEWIDHHLRFGCQHFYLINNESSDNYQEILAPYRACGLVDVMDEPGNFRQWFAYDKWYLETLRHESRWVAIIDIDEYLYPRDGSDDIKAVLERYEDIDALAVPWLSFGSSGLVEQPKSIVHSFVYRDDYDKKGWTSFKTIVRTKALAERPTDNQKSWKHFVLGIHNHRLKNGRKLRPSCEPDNLKLLGEPLPYCLYFRESHIPTMSLAINHYRTMSRDYYQNIKMHRPSAATFFKNGPRGTMDYFNKYDTNIVLDEILKSVSCSTLQSK